MSANPSELNVHTVDLLTDPAAIESASVLSLRACGSETAKSTSRMYGLGADTVLRSGFLLCYRTAGARALERLICWCDCGEAGGKQLH